jgi:hypothetical protein
MNKKIRKLTLSLRWIIYIAIAVTVGDLLILLVTDHPIALMVEGEIWSSSTFELPFQARWTIYVLHIAPSAIWVYGLVCIIRLCKLYEEDVFFTTRNTLQFKRFGFSLVFLSLIDTISFPIMNAVIYWSDTISSMSEFSVFDILEIDTLMGGILCIVVAKIMEIACTLKEESDLTI